MLFSSGFGELGARGKELEHSLLATARASGVRICGPNTLGLVSAFDRATATFSQYADAPPLAGPVGFASQSGAFGTGISALARSRGLGFGYFVSTGNTADITPVEDMREMLEDERIRVLAGYLEGLADGAALVELAAEALDRGKPLVVTKVGRIRPAPGPPSPTPDRWQERTSSLIASRARPASFARATRSICSMCCPRWYATRRPAAAASRSSPSPAAPAC